MTEQIKLRCSGREYALTLDLTQLMGDTVEELEEHLGGEGLVAWVQRFGGQMERGVRVRDLRSRDIIALVFIARSQTEPGTTWQDVAQSIAPYTLEIIDDAAPSSAAPTPTAPTSASRLSRARAKAGPESAPVEAATA